MKNTSKKYSRYFKHWCHAIKRKSTGIGLTIVKKIVELYGGKVWVTSKIGEGSTFFFTLPKTINQGDEKCHC